MIDFNVTFGDGTDIDMWKTVFCGLHGYTVRLTDELGKSFDVEFMGVRLIDDAISFAYYSTDERVGHLRTHHVDRIKAIHIY